MNATAHRLTAGTAIALYFSNEEAKAGRQTLTPILGGLAGSIFTCIPDVLEPATSPNHRNFFHSIACAGLLITALVKLNRWQPESDADRFWRGVGMIAVASYLIHLTLDATTAKSLPLLGRI